MGWRVLLRMTATLGTQLCRGRWGSHTDSPGLLPCKEGGKRQRAGKEVSLTGVPSPDPLEMVRCTFWLVVMCHRRGSGGSADRKAPPEMYARWLGSLGLLGFWAGKPAAELKLNQVSEGDTGTVVAGVCRISWDSS